MRKNKKAIKKALWAAFPHTIPIMAGFLFLGISYGIYAAASGFHFIYPMVMSFTIYGGSLEFVAVSMLMGSFAPIQTLMVSVLIQARHLFYGISMLDRFKGTGLKKFYLIFGLCDETFSINYSTEPPEGVDKGWFMFFVTLLNQLYWVTGASLGGILGSLIQIDLKGIEFVMTAMFTVIFLEQWLKEKRHISALIGVIASIVCLIIFGADNFLIPTMICIILFLSVLRKPIEKAGDSQ
ncbi:MAG: AzlC family ABC transporter permease [Butyrivibrio sp.]